jgi:hypothetical protein
MLSAAIAAAATIGSLQAHHANVMFDMTAPVWLEGTVVTYTPVNPHTLFELDVVTAGQTRRWTIEGPFLARLKRLKADEHFLRPGDVVEVCGFPFKEKLGLRAATAGGFDVASFVHGHVLVMPDGRLRAWGPYGKIDNCVRPDDDARRWVEFLNADALAREAWCDKARAAIPTRPEVRELVAAINRSAGDLCAPRVP